MSSRAGGCRVGRRAGIGRRPRFDFWLTFFFQSYMLLLFCNGLLSLFGRDEEEDQ